jgi:hypothetical protein
MQFRSMGISIPHRHLHGKYRSDGQDAKRAIRGGCTMEFHECVPYERPELIVVAGRCCIVVTTHGDMGSIYQEARALEGYMKKIEGRFRFTKWNWADAVVSTGHMLSF